MRKRTINYQYAILAHTPILHSAEQLQIMYKNAVNRYQKSCIMYHITYFDVVDIPDYKKLYNKLYDEFA